MVKLSQILQNRGIFSNDIKTRLKNGQIKINGIVQKDNIEIPIDLNNIEFIDLGDLLFSLIKNPIWELQLKIFGIENLINSNIKSDLTHKLKRIIIIRISKTKAFAFIMLPKGTKRRLKDNHDHWYVKNEDLDFAWWSLEKYPDLEDHKKMRVRMTDEMVLKESHFEFF